MVEKPETRPPTEYVSAVVDRVAADVITRLSEEVGHPLRAEVSLFLDGSRIEFSDDVSSGGNDNAIQTGEIRIRFRPTYQEDRYLFFLDSVFERDERTPAFSGFTVRGDIGLKDATPAPQYRTWTVKWNDFGWRNWL